MMRMPSIALIEIIILAIVVGLPLLVGGLVLAIVVKRQIDRRTQADPQPGSDIESSRSSYPGKWLLLLGLAVILAFPLVVIAGGSLIVLPVRNVHTTQQDLAPQVQLVAMSPLVETPLVATPIPTPRPTSKPGSGSVKSPPPQPAFLTITPDDDLLFLILPGMAGLAVLFGVGFIAVVLTRWRHSDPRPSKVSDADGGKRSRWDIALVAFGAVAALTIFVILALGFSLYFFIWFVVIFAGCLIAMGLLLLVPRLVARWKGKYTQLRDLGIGDDNRDAWARTARLRYALLALAIWFALSIFLILDAGFSVSVYLQFVAIYALFWVLIGLLLLVGSPRREKLLILGLFVVVLFSIRAVDWNSRKPFLKDLYRVQEGMTLEQVEQIMSDYMGGIGYPIHPLGLPAGPPAAETEGVAVPDRLVYRHTNEGWGDSDWGEIRFEKGRVVEVRFLPD